MADPTPNDDRAVVLVVDDDPLFVETIAVNLEDAGYKVVSFSDGRSALDYLGQGSPASVVLLDWRMPGLDGLQVLRKMRDAKLTTPAIFLTSLSDQIYEEAALIGGAIDFVEKSRSFSIILKRIQVALSGAKTPSETLGASDARTPAANQVRLGSLRLDNDSHRAFWKDNQLDLTLTEFKVVRLLAGQSGKDVSYRHIYDVVRGEGFSAGHGEDGYRTNVRSLVKRLREKFTAYDKDFAQIENYPGFGYRWLNDEDTSKQ